MKRVFRKCGFNYFIKFIYDLIIYFKNRKEYNLNLKIRNKRFVKYIG